MSSRSVTTVKSAGRHPARLVALLITDDGEPSTHTLPVTGTVTLGRSPDCELAIDHVSVSRRHAQLRLGSEITIEDLGSANGTSIGGESLAPHQPRPLAPGMIVHIGSVVLVVQSIPASSGRTKPADPSRPAGATVIGGTMHRLEELAKRIAASTLPVLILGETGVGKERLAEVLHRVSPRAAHPLLRLNCAAFSATLLENELFGHERGAFTGAEQAKPGLLETAHRGSVLLDEIGDLPLQLQAKLLRVLDERCVLPLGAVKTRPIDVRFMAATNRDLEADVAAGSFRADLYYRLRGVTLVIPPLRERPEEILEMARCFLVEAAGNLAIAPTLTSAAALALVTHTWPGNVRELRTTMERALLLSTTGTVDVEHLGRLGAANVEPVQRLAPAQTSTIDVLERELHDARRTRIAQALEASGGNQTEAARILGVSRRTLLNWLDEHGFVRPRKGSRR